MPSKTTIRNRINSNYEKFVNNIREKFRNKMFYLTIDETQIEERRYVNVLIGYLEHPDKYYLVNCIEIFEPPNSRNQGIIIDDVIKYYSLDRENFFIQYWTPHPI